MLNYFYIASDLAGLLASYIEEQGLNADGLLEQVCRDGNDAAGKRMSYEHWCSYLEALYELSGDRGVGISLGSAVKPQHCGVLGYLSLNCEFLGEALLYFERYQRLLYEGGLGTAEVTADRIRFTWPFHEASLGIALSDEVLVFGLASFVRRMVGPTDAHPIATGFTHAPLTDIEVYREAIGGGEFEFNASTMYIEFSTEYLALPVINSDPSLRALLDQQAETLLMVLPNDSSFEEELKQQLLKILQEGDPTLNRLAKAMCMSSRTLHRRLEEKGINFAALLKRTRTELAMQYLREAQLSLTEIAFLLGYSEQSAFSRAFKQWTDQTPKQYQKAYR